MASTACALPEAEFVAQAISLVSVLRNSDSGMAPRPRGSKTLKQNCSALSSVFLQHCACAKTPRRQA